MKLEKSFEGMTKEELLVLAKSLSIVGRHKMNKNELISEISERVDFKFADASSGKEKYIENLEVGQIVAFHFFDKEKGKQIVKSAKVDAIDGASIRLVTKEGCVYASYKENIIWVKTGARWPKGVYELLKGVKEYAE